MPYELQLKPFIPKAGWKYTRIQFTDIAFHTSPKKPTSSIGKKIKEAFKLNKPGRIYGSIDNSDSTPYPEKKLSVIDMLKEDPELFMYIKEQERNGYKVLLEVPNDLPLIPGKDTIEFTASVNGKRIIRGFAKNNLNN